MSTKSMVARTRWCPCRNGTWYAFAVLLECGCIRSSSHETYAQLSKQPPALSSSQQTPFFWRLQGLDNHVPYQHTRSAGVVRVRQGRRSHGGSSGCDGNSPRWNRLLDPPFEPMRQPLRFPHGRGVNATTVRAWSFRVVAWCRSLKRFGVLVIHSERGSRMHPFVRPPHGSGFVVCRCVLWLRSPPNFRGAVCCTVCTLPVFEKKNCCALGVRIKKPIRTALSASLACRY